MAYGPGRNFTPVMQLRRSQRHSSASQPSGSEYHESDKSVDMDHNDPPPQPERQIAYSRTARGRRIQKKYYRESASEDDGVPKADELFEDEALPRRSKRSTPPQPQANPDGDAPDEDEEPIANPRTRLQSRRLTVHSDEEGKPGVAVARLTRSQGKVAEPPQPVEDRPAPKPRTRAKFYRQSRRRSAKEDHQEGDYIDEPTSGSGSADADADGDADASFEDAPHSSEPEPEEEEDDVVGDADDLVVQEDGKPYALRRRSRKVNYTLPPPLVPPKGRSNGGRSGGGGSRNSKSLGWSASGAELGRWMGMPADDSDSDYGARTPRKPFAAGAAGGGIYNGNVAGGMMPSDLAAAAGTPSNLGKIGDAALADADPLGVNTNVTFDEVGGLDDHIHSLKEMTLLPLLYPEVFQRFNVTPPRGVLFHGPPGTGKTLLARALAASCRSEGKQISFFMRKGADCLSKWVGEAERQLRLLFEEAKNCQPSIIFFDEIDGLAPVRSSKQDQIHASIVSTLLALMDGMDGRGQVVVIGATNRPDAIDPALRRPGRFDREFYFPLPGLAARERILEIMTKGWDGWEAEKGSENVKGLAKMTKGYGGADLRALCTEAALNAVQRRYPQIYQSNDRLLLAPETIQVGLRDFMISIKKLVPSSARSSSSVAAPLPVQFLPLLSKVLERVKAVISEVLPVGKKRTALEEAEWEEDNEEGALDRELMMQSMDTLRVYRPRMILHGPPGLGQNYVGAAALHHLEGYHIQSLELGTLLNDSTRTVEAAIVQLFVEAKRHQPSVIYIPSLVAWCAAVSETSRLVVRSMLDTLAPTDPILLLAIVDGPISVLPGDVRAWFGQSHDNRVELTHPTQLQREEFFEAVLTDAKRPPNEFPDGIKRKKRVLEKLPIAPPLEPRQPTAAELALQQESDNRIIVLLQYRLGPILTELKRKFKRFTKRATEEYRFEDPVDIEHHGVTTATTVEVHQDNDGVAIVIDEERTSEQLVNGFVDAAVPNVQPVREPQPQLYDMDLERMHTDLYKGKYLTPHDFLDDVKKIAHNAEARFVDDPERLYKAQAMLTAAQVSINDFDPQLRMECDRMAPRERQRREESRKNKVKGKAPEDNGNGSYAPGTRRSARNNGLQPEIPITDPLKLERRLKRQRPAEAAAESSISEDENSDSRSIKRSKMVVSDEYDPLDIVGPTSSQPRPPAVRFAPDVQLEKSPCGLSPIGERTPESDRMAIDSELPMRRTGFDPALLNPMPPSSDPFALSVISPNDINGSAPINNLDPSDPFQTLLTQDLSQQSSFENISPPHTPVRTAGPSKPLVAEPPQRSPTPIVVERPPTPLPDFHVDEELLNNLKRHLRDRTGSLTVEQLEQLRATCLSCVWRHRAEWNRDRLIQELSGIVEDFVDEVIDGVE